jgi:hypothetical protein
MNSLIVRGLPVKSDRTSSGSNPAQVRPAWRENRSVTRRFLGARLRLRDGKKSAIDIAKRFRREELNCIVFPLQKREFFSDLQAFAGAFWGVV